MALAWLGHVLNTKACLVPLEPERRRRRRRRRRTLYSSIAHTPIYTCIAMLHQADFVTSAFSLTCPMQTHATQSAIKIAADS